MVSRWKQYITRTTSEFVSNQAVISNVVLSDSTNGSGKMEDSMIAEGSFQEKDTNLLREGATHGSAASFDSCNSLKTNNEKTKSNGGISQLTADSTASSQVTGASGEGSFPSFSSKINPLEAQIPPFDIFSKRDMSTFLGSRKMSKPSYFSYQVKRVECLPESRSFEPKIVGRAKSSNGSASMSNSHSAWTTINGYSEGEMNYRADANISTTVNSDIDNVNTNSQRTGDDKDKARLALRDEDLGLIEGDMCASSTGVVRVQSRKKAEMFLVRTDGYSCTRERVSESSLAFTHPSTQQQMLLWKSTPKTVLVLKKLGDHLMEEAREVVLSFSFHL